jgi:hypothetical protein
LYDHEIGTQNVKDFYDAREKYGPYKATLDRLAKTDLEKAIAFQEKHVFELTMAQAIDHSLSELSKVREIQTFLRSKAAVTAGYTQEDRDAHMKEARQVEQELVAGVRELYPKEPWALIHPPHSDAMASKFPTGPSLELEVEILSSRG